MDKQILLIASKLLDQASDQFSNHGCNDLDKEVLKVITDEDGITEGIREHFNDEGYPENVSQVADWSLMDYISYKLKEESLKQ
tara:strand:- start:266 stop:514 length:249 start_codon:yes stop_codon:yes gene_type:complete